MPNITTLFEGTDGVSRTLFNQKLSDVNAHGNSTTMHVTAVERAAWNGKANGNNAVWVATEVGAPDNNNSCVLTIPNFIFTEGCQITYKATAKPKSSTQYNCIKINNTGDWYALRNPVGEVLDDDAWEVGANVTVTLSSKSFNHPQNWPTAFFKSGSESIKEMFDFPLSIQAAEPTPVNTNHIWIINNIQRQIVIEDAMRTTPGGDRYWLLTDNQDNSYVNLYGPKSFTDGSTYPLFFRKIERDIVPWQVMTSHEFAKKKGISYTGDIKSKWPRVMSRVGSTIDVENAKRWDGSAWQWLSQKGHYLLNSLGVMNRTEYTLSNFKAVKTDTSTCYSVAITSDGLYYAKLYVKANGNSVLEIYLRTGDTFALNSSLTLPILSIGTWVLQALTMRFSPDNNYLAIPFYNTTYIFKKQSIGTWAQLTTLPTYSYEVYNGVCWNSTGSVLYTITRNYSDDDYDYENVRPFSRNFDTFSAQAYISVGKYSTHLSTAVSVGNYLCYTPYSYVSSGGDTRALRFINTGTNTLIKSISGNAGVDARGYTALVYAGNNKVIWNNPYSFSASQLMMYNITTGAQISASDAISSIVSMAVSPDYAYLFVVTTSDFRVYSIGTSVLTLLSTATDYSIFIAGFNLVCW